METYQPNLLQKLPISQVDQHRDFGIEKSDQPIHCAEQEGLLMTPKR